MVQDFNTFSCNNSDELKKIPGEIPDKLSALGYRRVHWTKIDDIPDTDNSNNSQFFRAINKCIDKVKLREKWTDIVYFFNDSVFNDGGKYVVFYAK